MNEFRSNMTDEELDDLFREAAAGIQPQADEASFKKIAGRIRGASGASPLRYISRSRVLLAGAAATVLAGLIWIFLSQRPALHKEVASSSPSIRTSSGKSPEQAEHSSSVRPFSTSVPSNPELATGSPSSGVSGSGSLSASMAKTGSVTLSEQPSGHAAGIFTKGAAMVLTGLEPSPVRFDQPIMLNSAEALQLAMRSRVPRLPLAEARQADSGKQQKVSRVQGWTSPSKARSSSLLKADSLMDRWDISLVSGPDWSTVKYTPWSTPGLDVGIFGGYHFKIPLSIHAGFVVVGKKYVAQPSQYHPKTMYVSTSELHEITAFCRAVNIPIELRYDLWKGKRNHLAAGIGVASYWFLKEEYTFHYKTAYQPSEKYLEFENESKNPFSELSVSIDFDHYVTKHVSIGVRPYYQFPLAGIGYGRVRLRSAGTIVSAAYHF